MDGSLSLGRRAFAEGLAAFALVFAGCGRRDHDGLCDACPIYPGKRYEDWELENPEGKDLETVRRIRDEIATRVMALIDEIAPPKGNIAAT